MTYWAGTTFDDPVERKRLGNAGAHAARAGTLDGLIDGFLLGLTIE